MEFVLSLSICNNQRNFNLDYLIPQSLGCHQNGYTKESTHSELSFSTQTKVDMAKKFYLLPMKKYLLLDMEIALPVDTVASSLTSMLSL